MKRKKRLELAARKRKETLGKLQRRMTQKTFKQCLWVTTRKLSDLGIFDQKTVLIGTERLRTKFTAELNPLARARGARVTRLNVLAGVLPS